MLTVNQDFKNALQAPIKQVSGYLVLQDGTTVLPSGDLQKFTISSTGGFLRTAMSKFTATITGEHQLIGTTLDAYYGVFYDDEWNYALKGKFQITDAAYKKDKNCTEITGYDNMIRFQSDYTPTGIYPMTLYGYLVAICSLAGVVLANGSIYNGSLTIPEDYYQNINEYTIRDILEDICEASASHAVINAEGELELRQVVDTGETFTYENFIEYEIGDKYGGVNSLVLSRQPQNDDVFVRDEDSINAPTTRNILDLTRFRVGYSMEED